MTPIYNANTEYVRRADSSLKMQSIGYENIEWIIVANNCEEGYVEQLRDVVYDTAITHSGRLYTGSI